MLITLGQVYEVVTRLNVEYLDDEEMEAFEEEMNQANTIRLAGENINLKDLVRRDTVKSCMLMRPKRGSFCFQWM